MTRLDPSDLETVSLSDVGRVRSQNQDACAELRGRGGARLVVVADGMGGHEGGEVASRMAVETLREWFEEAEQADAELLERAIVAANERVHRAAEADAHLHGMGTTCVALLFGEGGRTWVAHVGDSRAYRLRDRGLERLTADHSVVADLQRRGLLTAEEAALHPRRNEILRSVGVAPTVDVEISSVEVGPGDRFLLCSDGLCGVLSDEEIGAVLRDRPALEAVRELVERVNARGAPDNVTVLVTSVPAAATVSSRPRATRPPRSDAARRRLRWMAFAAALVTGFLALALLLLLATGSEVCLPSLADPSAAGERAQDVAAPPPLPEPEREQRGVSPRDEASEPLGSR